MTPSLACLDPRSLRNVIACILQVIMPLHKVGSGHTKLGETIVGHLPAREISRVAWYFTKHDGVVTYQVNNENMVKALQSIVYIYHFTVCAEQQLFINKYYVRMHLTVNMCIITM